uniref:DUF4585 domain-containing protein n=1 Tax=Monopterus albus TaxID=43700 RepID=A0A3Q3IJ89_MONAL
MEAAEETLIYRDDTRLHRKLLPEDKDKGHAIETKSDESNYVDLDMKPEGAKTVKVTFTGERNQLPVIKCDSSKRGEHGKKSKIISEGFVEEQSGDKRATVPGPVSGEPPLETLIELPVTDQDSENEKLDVSDCSEHVCSESDELQYTDMYLNSKTESDEGISAVLSDHCGSDTVEDESHYITTHEIQLTELDHDVDYDLGRGTCWDFEDDNLVYSFVDYTSFESDETQEEALIEEGNSQEKVQSNLGGAVVSTEQESDLCDSDKCASSDESESKNQSAEANAGEIHLSINTSSRAVNEPVSIFDSGACDSGDRNHFSFVSSGARAEPLCDRAQYFIPAPGRQHIATKLRRKDINEYSSGGSSSISELDDADKEVRNLTAKSFRSLACPYFDAINLSTSSESSLSECGLNQWSAYVDWNYENVSQREEKSVIAHMNTTMTSNRQGESLTDVKAPQTRMYELKKEATSQQLSSLSNKIEYNDCVQSQQSGVTLNFCCNVEAPEGTRHPQCSKNTSSDVTESVLTGAGCEIQYHHTGITGDTQKSAICASSLLKNVISKKMQFEQERKMERGEICDIYPALGRGLQRQISELGSGFSVNYADDQGLEGSRLSSSEPTEEQKRNKVPDNSEKGQHEPPKALTHSQSSAFNPPKKDEPVPVKESEPTALSDTQTTTKEDLDTSNMLTKLHLVPSCQLLSKEKDFKEDLTSHTPATGIAAGPQKCEKEIKTGNNGYIEASRKWRKAPEIKIHLRSVKENKGCTLNIASLLTPKISFNTVNTFRAAGESKCHIWSAADKVPNFTVKDITGTKCKFQTPIYHVRDVRKLVKSSYHFVSLNNSDSKRSTATDKLEERAKREPVKHLLPSPIVIKCHSVKTNVKSQATETSQKQAEAGIQSETSHSENTPSHCTTSRVPPIASKQAHPYHSESQQNIETKLSKQRQIKFTAETAKRRNDPMIPKQAAIEKLKAAVKTMEQLYDFDRNEWRRKTHTPQPIAGSHVLSLIASEEQGAKGLEKPTTDRIQINTIETGKLQEDKGAVKAIHVPYNDTFKAQSQQSTFSNKSVLHLGNCNEASICISSVSNAAPQSSVLQTSTMKSSKTLVAPLSVKIESPKHDQVVERQKVTIGPTPPTVTRGSSDSENYLTIPRLRYTNEIKLHNQEPLLSEGTSNISQTHTGDSKKPEQKRSPLIMEFPATSIYHHPAAGTTGPQVQQQVLCFSPVPAVSPAPSSGETAPQTKRKMLLDPATGHYYLVDTPIQATTKRLFDPETGQYVDVPMSHSPVSPITPVSPVPLSLSPLALSPGTYTPTYMICPGFIPSPTLSSQAVLPQSLYHSEDAGGEKVKNSRSPRPETNTTGAERAYYSATGEASQGLLQLPVSLGHVATSGAAASSERKPIISITTQQGPRIVAPPSFDGTTMSFVVEHR